MTSPYRSSRNGYCFCCGQYGAKTPVQGGGMHFRCWDEHHSDPFGEWPRGHVCALNEDAS